ncbi:putative transporter YycB [Pigmentiphaga humi]|uniref:Putative transporter YycB n=1 Tax=Pigmentiphaga humi TaxID=2478468 RepID=A0A3P4B6T4_9BURK|nr:MFS transporter [Pigmentiphaga humi]VCU70885.1 putative transporter YycB [Pigmentiphaga humi]
MSTSARTAGGGAPSAALSPALALLGILLVAATLRSPLTGVGPLLGDIRADTGLDGGTAGLLNTLPLLAFGIFSLLAPTLGRRLGLDRTLFLAMALLSLGIVLRSMPGVPLLFIGTLIAGITIAVGNVMMPVLVKREFPTRVGPMTGAYSVFMTMTAGLAAGVAVPVANLLPGGWRTSLACVLVFTVPAALVWLHRSRRAPPASAAPGGQSAARTNVWRSPLAWQVTLFNGIQAFNFYILMSWLPSMLHDQGMTAVQAGWMVSMMQVAALLSNIMVSTISTRVRDQKLLGLAVSLLCLAGFAGIAFYPPWIMLWICVAGAGLGGSLLLSLACVSLRSATAQQAISLSGMAQSVGYLIGAAGPVVCGLLRDWSGSWLPALVLIMAMAAVQCWFGYRAGRPLTIGEHAPAPQR